MRLIILIVHMIKKVNKPSTILTAINAVLIFIALTIVLIFSTNVSYATISIPESIRIGLYADTSAVASVNVTWLNSADIMSVQPEKSVPLMSFKEAGSIYIRKNSFFINTGGLVVEYKEGDQNLPEGEKFGPYHIEILRAIKSYDDAASKASDFEANGVQAFPVYNGQWSVWTGRYIDKESAQKDLDEVVSKKLGAASYIVTEPDPSYMQIVSNDNKVIMMYSGKSLNPNSVESFAALSIIPKSPEGEIASLALNGNKYRGHFEFNRFAKSDLTVVNIVDFEHYLYGVVPREIGALSHVEALKAQAVAARTYSIMNMGKHGSLGFDLCATTHCQVYGGLNVEHKNTNKAVDDTKGKKVTYNGKLASVFYFSSDGGVTEDVKNVWGSTDYPYLVSVEDKYESGNSYNYTWSVKHSIEKLKELLVSKNSDVGNVVSVRATEFAETGRVTKLNVTGSSGEKEFLREKARTIFSLPSQMYTISSDADIHILGFSDEESAPNERSTIIAGLNVIGRGNIIKVLQQSKNTVKVLGAEGVVKQYNSFPKSYTFDGRGWGHAVGLSQEGARGMANAGFKYDEILTHFLPGTVVD